MFEIGWSELVLIGVVALIVIGPKELPEMFRTLGRFTAKMRGLAREFSRAMDAAANESGLKDAAKDIREAANLPRGGLDAVKDAARKFEQWDPLKGQRPGGVAESRTAKPTLSNDKPPAPAAPAPEPAAEAPAAEPQEATPAPKRGPATQALADAQAARRRSAAAARRAAAKAAEQAEAPPAAEPPPAKAASKAPSRASARKGEA